MSLSDDGIDLHIAEIVLSAHLGRTMGDVDPILDDTPGATDIAKSSILLTTVPQIVGHLRSPCLLQAYIHW